MSTAEPKLCPECGTELREREERYSDCEDCGFELFPPHVIALRDEVRAEYERAKKECWPDPVPSYKEWSER